MFDVVLRAGWIVDGSGAPPTRADLGMRGDRVAAIGDLADADAAVIVECANRYLLPGFIDAHAHVDALVFDPDVQIAALAQGVTTFVVGQDGLSFAPASPATASHVSGYFGAVNGEWPGPAPRTTAEWLAAYDATTPFNVAVLVPQGNLRHEALGAADLPADATAIARMRALLEASLSEGAVGLSSGLDYIPGRFADAAELASLCEVTAKAGVPYVTHMRGYEAAAGAGLAEVAAIAKASGVATHVSHLHGPAEMIAGLLDGLRVDGVDVTFDSYPYTSGSSILAMVTLPAQLQAGGTAATLRALAAAPTRADLRRSWFPERAQEMARVRLAYVAATDFAWAEGLSLPDAAAQAGADIADFVCDLLIAADLRVGCVFRQPPTNTDADVAALLRHEAHAAGSDGIYLGSRPHPRGWGTFARYLGLHTRQLGDWTWGEAAVHLAGRAARRFGLAGRGVLRAGAAADVVVLDPARVADRATYDEPRRPAIGIDRVYVNGALAYAGGEITSPRCGRGLRG